MLTMAGYARQVRETGSAGGYVRRIRPLDLSWAKIWPWSAIHSADLRTLVLADADLRTKPGRRVAWYRA
jgi:hypothetical protein